jgi:hypothetical protein
VACYRVAFTFSFKREEVIAKNAGLLVWDAISLGRWFSVSQFWPFFLDSLSSTMTALRSPAVSVITNAASHSRSPEPQIYHRETHKFHKLQEAGEKYVFMGSCIICIGLLNQTGINRLQKWGKMIWRGM